MKSNQSYNEEMPNSGQNCRFVVPCDLEIWWMTFKINRAPLLYYVKLCTSFQTNRCIQTGVTVQKRSIWVKISNFLCCVTLKFDRWPWKTIEHLFYATWSFVHHFITICQFKLEFKSGNGLIGSWPLWPWPLTSDLDVLHGHHFCQW